jgi:hypothetical protein
VVRRRSLAIFKERFSASSCIIRLLSSKRLSGFFRHIARPPLVRRERERKPILLTTGETNCVRLVHPEKGLRHAQGTADDTAARARASGRGTHGGHS